MAARSVTISMINLTTQTLTLVQSPPLAHGQWQTPPPATIAKKASWEAVSDGLATGVQGSLVYQIGSAPASAPPPPSQPKTPSVTLTFDNPFVGSDDFEATVSSGFNCAVTSNSGNDATVTYTLSAL
ncbi:MAG TPA: hypothetical protein VMU84_12405 [Thermoanaerobaculia bacterium]|nr:hypothetical protein [Thermoanaerobaculia bacterium]